MPDVLNRPEVKIWLDKAEKDGWLSDYEFAALMRGLVSEKPVREMFIAKRMRLNAKLALGLSKTISYNPSMWELFDYIPDDSDAEKDDEDEQRT